MDSGHVKSVAEKAKGAIKDTTDKITRDKESPAAGKFDKPLGSSHNDEADMRDVAQKAAEKSK
jgi:uncharacterized protein YjbJ (UPF0337 family)